MMYYSRVLIVNNFMNRVIRYLLCFLPCAFVFGCSKPAEPMHPVAGSVRFNGKPLHKGDIVFVPDAAKGNPHLEFGIGKLDALGKYEIQTFKKEGVKPGWYKVMVLASENEPEANLAWVPIWIVPERYTKPETTKLAIEVVANPTPNCYDLVIEP